MTKTPMRRSYAPCYRRWAELPELQRHVARFGEADARKRFTQPVHRDKTGLLPLDQVSMDGRTQDFFVDMGDGRAVRPTMLVLTDIATNKVLGWRLTKNENAVDTVQMIRDTVKQHGIFRRLNTDNGSAFAGHLVAGGNVHFFRSSSRKIKGVRPLGVCHHLGIELRFHKLGNAKAKLAERTFATFSRAIDDQPEMKGTHTGHDVGSKVIADGNPLPLDDANRIIQREVARRNAEPSRRSQGANGRSYDQHFADGVEKQIVSVATERQLYLAGLIYTDVGVDRAGQVRVDNAIFGSPTTQAALMPFHGKGQRVLLGRNPDIHGNDAIYLPVARGEGKASNVAAALMEMHRDVASGKSLTVCREIVALYIGRSCTLVVDEAQYLKSEGAEWLCALVETAECDLVLCGDQELIPLVAAIPQLESRMCRKVLIGAVPVEDVAMMAQAAGFPGEDAIRVLHAIARMRGGLRNVENVLRMAMLFAGRDAFNVQHLKAAVVDMKLAPKGGDV